MPVPPDRPLIGVDFSSAPSRRKPIVIAQGRLHRGVLRLEGLMSLPTLPDFGDWLQQQPAWLGGFDLPFGLPRELVQAWGWPLDWAASQDRWSATPRPELQAALKAFCDARPAGGKFAHRACDGPAGSSPSMKWVNPPVAWMMHAGVPLLRAAGPWFPAHQAAAPEPLPARIALEAYPGLLARAVLGRRSYKSDDATKQTDDRLLARRSLVEALSAGLVPSAPGAAAWPRLQLSAGQRDQLVADGRGDTLDAVLCLVQAARAAGLPDFGLPPGVDPLEGWILGA